MLTILFYLVCVAMGAVIGVAAWFRYKETEIGMDLLIIQCDFFLWAKRTGNLRDPAVMETTAVLGIIAEHIDKLSLRMLSRIARDESADKHPFPESNSEIVQAVVDETLNIAMSRVIDYFSNETFEGYWATRLGALKWVAQEAKDRSLGNCLIRVAAPFSRSEKKASSDCSPYAHA